MGRGLLTGLIFTLIPLCLGAQADPLYQRVSIRAEDQLLEEALVYLIEQQGVLLSFSQKTLPRKRISLRESDMLLRDLLEVLLQDTGLAYERIGAQVVIYRKQAEKFTLSGYVEDIRSGERLISATVYDQRSGLGTVSNAYGFFSLTLPADSIELVVRYLGYEPESLSFRHDRNRPLLLRLQPALTLEEVEVIAPRVESSEELPFSDELTATLRKKLPRLGGESDILRTAYFMPGVQTGADGIGGLHVRGGDRGQNLVLLDGVPVYDLAHAGGLISLFPDESIKKARLIKGAFPARYGGRLSSVLDIHTKEGSLKSWGGMAGISMLTSRLALEGPLVPDKVSLFGSARWSHLGLYLRPYSRRQKALDENVGQLDYAFFDLQFKINYLVSRKHRLYLSFYRGRDQFTNDNAREDTLRTDLNEEIESFLFSQELQERNEWGNTLGVLRWNYLVSPRLFSNLSLTFSRLDVLSNTSQEEVLRGLPDQVLLDNHYRLRNFSSRVQDIGLKSDWEWMISPDQAVRFGSGGTHHEFSPGLLRLAGDSAVEPGSPQDTSGKMRALEWWLYAEDEFSLKGGWDFNLGLRYAGWHIRGRTFHVVEPRLAVAYRPWAALRLRASVSRMSQFVHLLSNSEVGLPTDLWVPATAETGFQASWQTSLGAEWMPWKGWMLNLEGYFKRLDPLVALSEGAQASSNWEQNITRGSGRAWGIEWVFSRTAGPVTGWVSYGLSYTRRTYERINFGRPYPLRYDRRHDIKLALAYDPKPWISVSCSWMMNSGLAFNLPVQQFEVEYPGLPEPNPILVFGDKNEFRMPWYHRLDLGATMTFGQNKRIRHVLYAGLYNVYNRMNPLYIQLEEQVVEEEGKLRTRREFRQVFLLPVLPSLSYATRI